MICYTYKIFDLHFIIYLWKFLLFTVYFAISYVLLLLFFFNMRSMSYNNRGGIQTPVLFIKESRWRYCLTRHSLCPIDSLMFYILSSSSICIHRLVESPQKKKKNLKTLQKDERMISPSLSLSLNTSEYEHTQHWKTCWSNMLDMFIVK